MKGAVKRGQQSKKDAKLCTPVVVGAWILIAGWVLFLSQWWDPSALSFKSSSTVMENMNHTEYALRGKLSKIRDELVKVIKAKEAVPVNPIVEISLNDIKLEEQETDITESPVLVTAESSSAMDPSNLGEPEVHVVFSTDCGGFQDWQTLTVFHSATVIGQKGTITRIASGCPEEKKSILTDLYKKLYPQYHVHFTPDYKKDPKTQKSYDFYNKPYGVLHWLDNASPPIKSGVVIALIDPDMIFLRPLTAKVAGEPNVLFSSGSKDEIFEYIGKGKPAAQQYGLGAPWVYPKSNHFDKHAVCGDGSPCLVPTNPFAANHYSVGPPYMVEKDDLHRIAKTWTTFVPKVYERYPELLAEMYAYSMASAHEELPHLQLDHYMVSNTDAGGEGWDWVDAIDDTCAPPVDGVYFPGQPLPTLLHFCQFFRVGEFGFQKRRLSHSAFSCEAPMLLEPPPDLSRMDWKRTDDKKQKKIGALQGKRHAFAMCILHRSINAALTDYKTRMCEGNANTNYEKKINLLWDW